MDDVNPSLFSGADQDSRPGNIATGQQPTSGQSQAHAQIEGLSRTFVVGKRIAEIALDGNRYSRALQTYSRHHFTLTCGTQTYDQEFRTANIPAGDTRSEGPPVDRSHPGQYSYPTIQWSNAAQALIDPATGLRSRRATALQDSASPAQAFVTAIDPQSAWQNASAPLTNTGGAASYSGPCVSGFCPLFLRADNFTIPGGPTYAANLSSLDWVTVSMGQASLSGVCSGEDCKVEACLTVDGIDCASSTLEAVLSTTPANFTYGSGNLMDLWQGSGPPQISRVDVSQASGTVNYSAAQKQVSVAGGSPFNVKWKAGSAITMAGSQYTIASVQNEQLLTLESGPNSDLSGVPYSANNFGVLLWKKTPSSNRISIGYTTFTYGTSPMPTWTPANTIPCSTVVTVGGVPGYNCFFESELFWLAADGSDVRDLGVAAFTYFGGGEWSQGGACGSSSQSSPFDPQNGDVWYCLAYPYFDYNRASVVQMRYMGPHTQYVPGKQLPDCAANGGVQPCLQVTLMQPNKADSINSTAPNFNPALNASGFVPCCYQWIGISGDGDLAIGVSNNGQDSDGWFFIYTLGDRTPTGTTPNSFRIVAAGSSYLTAPESYCSYHSATLPDSGWIGIYNNNLSNSGPKFTFQMTMTSAALNMTPGAPGGLSACPQNPLGASGQACTVITVTGQPTAQAGGISQKLQVGDLIQMESETLRVVSIDSPTQFTVQRGYNTTAGTHTTFTLTMSCGTLNAWHQLIGLWNYRNDPYATNPNLTTILNDPQASGGHNFIGGGVYVMSNSTDGLGESVCPIEVGGDCYQVRRGNLHTASQTSQQFAVTYSPPFAGKMGIGGPNVVDSHPGPCFNGVCLDGRPYTGGGSAYPSGISSLGSANAPFQLVSGQLWKLPAAQVQLNRKYLPTIAYAGRFPLVDVSGPASVLGAGAADSNKYCVAVASGECYSGSAPGDLFVNAPYVHYPYCYYPGIARQDDDTFSLCFGDMGAYTANLVQFSIANTDLVGSSTRRLGSNYAKWNQFDVFWNGFMSPNLALLGSQVRWLDGVRTDDLMTVLPPFPDPDGVTRNTFVPVPVKLSPPATLPVQSAIVEFGYVENGDAGNYYCTSRQETCVATAATVNLANPFTFQQSEGFTGQPCNGGCTIAIPALPQRALYYRWKYLGAGGQVLEVSQNHVVLTP